MTAGATVFVGMATTAIMVVAMVVARLRVADPTLRRLLYVIMDAERRCRQWQRQAERHQRRAEEADAWSDQFERDADSYQEAHSLLAERYAALYAAHTTLIRERLAANYTLIASNVERRRTDN